MANIQIDGSCAAIIRGLYHKRYDAKQGKIPHSLLRTRSRHGPWLKVDPGNKADQWLYETYLNAGRTSLEDGAYEAIGPHFQSNPYHLEKDTLERHGIRMANLERSYDGLRGKLH